MAVTYGSLTNVAYASHTSTICNKPTVSVGQVMVALFVNTGGNSVIANTLTPPSGWIEYTGITTTTFNAFGLFMRGRIYTRVVDGSEGASFTWNHQSGVSTAIATLVFAGVDTTTPITTVSQNNGTGGTSTYATITPSANGGLITWGLDFGDTANNLVVPSGTPTLTERLDATVQYVATADNVAGSATGSRTQTSNSTGSSPWWTAQIALGPSGAAAGPVAKKIIMNRQALIRSNYW